VSININRHDERDIHYNICYEKGDDLPESATKPVEKQTSLSLLHVY